MVPIQSEADAMQAMQHHRTEIDQIDDQIVALLARRYVCVDAIGAIKRQQGWSVVQPDRALQVRARTAARAEAMGIDGALLDQIYALIIAYAEAREADPAHTHTPVP